MGILKRLKKCRQAEQSFTNNMLKARKFCSVNICNSRRVVMKGRDFFRMKAQMDQKQYERYRLFWMKKRLS